MSLETLNDLRGRLDALVGEVDPATPQGRKRRRLIDAAIERFVAQGYRKTNIDEIARDAGVAKGTVYLYFESKPALLLAAVASEKRRLFDLLDGIYDPSAPPRVRLRRFVRAALLMVAGSPLITRFVDGDADFMTALAELDPALLAQATTDQRSFLGGLLDAAAAPASLDDRARAEGVMVLDALSALAPRLRDASGRHAMGLERVVDVFAAVFVDGIIAGIIAGTGGDAADPE
ncbi:MAG: helix-turn-helix domain-containing protein [Nannocystaceae bacterium]